MEIQITGKNMTVTEDIKEWIYRKASKLEKYAPRLVDSHVIVKKEKYFFVAEVTLHGKDLRVFGEAKDKENLFTAIDEACHRVAGQLRKFRERSKGHNQSKRTPRLSRRQRLLKSGIISSEFEEET